MSPRVRMSFVCERRPRWADGRLGGEVREHGA